MCYFRREDRPAKKESRNKENGVTFDDQPKPKESKEDPNKSSNNNVSNILFIYLIKSPLNLSSSVFSHDVICMSVSEQCGRVILSVFSV